MDSITIVHLNYSTQLYYSILDLELNQIKLKWLNIIQE